MKRIEYKFADSVPSVQQQKRQLELDDSGYIVAGEDTKTNIDGVFAAGDIRTKTVRQVVTAASDGAISGIMAEKYIGSC